MVRPERRWVRSAFGGEFNAALVAPFNSQAGRNLAAGTEPILLTQLFSPWVDFRKSPASCQSQSCPCVRQPFCDESGVGFGALLAENSTPLWSHHSIPRRDETWLPEWSGNLGGVERCAVRSRGVSWGKPVFRPSD